MCSPAQRQFKGNPSAPMGRFCRPIFMRVGCYGGKRFSLRLTITGAIGGDERLTAGWLKVEHDVERANDLEGARRNIGGIPVENRADRPLGLVFKEEIGILIVAMNELGRQGKKRTP